MKKTDVHNHPDWLGYDIDSFLENMNKNEIVKTWLLGCETPASEYAFQRDGSVKDMIKGTGFGALSFARCISYCERCPERFVPGYAPDPRDPDACKKLFGAHKIYGVKCCGEVKFRVMYNDFDCLRLFRLAGELQMPVILHFDYDFQRTMNDPYSYWYGGTIETLEDMLKKCPETVFVGHGPGFWSYMADDGQWAQCPYPEGKIEKEGAVARLIREYDNLFCDLSAGSAQTALNRDREYAAKFLLEFQDRLLFGRDYFDDSLEKLLDSFELPESVQEKIYFRNAEKLIAD